MSDLQNFFLGALAMVLVACVLVTPVGCTIHRHAQITKAIEAGADPIEAKCALEGDSLTQACLLIAAGKGAKK